MLQHQSRLCKEVDCLLEKEVPLVLGKIDELISSCLSVALGRSSSKHHWMCTSSTSGTEVLRGSFLLHRDTLCGMEVFMKPVKTVATVKASFRSDKQWKLQQVQDSLNHIKTVGKIVNTVIEEQQSVNHSPEGIVYLLDDIIKQTVRCQSRLSTPWQLSLNTLIGSAFSKMFVPPLPGDTLVNLYVLEDRLVLTHYTVQQAHTNASLSPNKQGKLHSPVADGKSLFHHTGSMFDHAGSRYEMATANRAECSVPLLSNLLSTAASVQALCQNLKDKIVTLMPYWSGNSTTRNEAIVCA